MARDARQGTPDYTASGRFATSNINAQLLKSWTSLSLGDERIRAAAASTLTGPGLGTTTRSSGASRLYCKRLASGMLEQVHGSRERERCRVMLEAASQLHGPSRFTPTGLRMLRSDDRDDVARDNLACFDRFARGVWGSFFDSHVRDRFRLDQDFLDRELCAVTPNRGCSRRRARVPAMPRSGRHHAPPNLERAWEGAAHPRSSGVSWGVRQQQSDLRLLDRNESHKRKARRQTAQGGARTKVRAPGRSGVR